MFVKEEYVKFESKIFNETKVIQFFKTDALAFLPSVCVEAIYDATRLDV